MTRDLYLEKKWMSYPAMPENVQARGRVQGLKTISEIHTEIQILSQNQVQTLTVSNSELIQVLIVGDIVAVGSNGEVTLLAPITRPAISRKTNSVNLKNWSLFLEHTRDFFNQNEFLEVVTPSLVTCPGTEPTLEVFATELKQGSRSEVKYLPTSPELHLKKCLSLGLEKIYEITRCYRNDELTEKHQPEFWMIEWYRAYENLDVIQRDVEKYVHMMSQSLAGAKVPQGSVKKTVQALFKEHFDFELTPQTDENSLRNLALKNKIDVHAASSIDDLFFLLFFEIESKMNPEVLTFVCDYPPYQAALARVNLEGWAERFEVYWQGMELANAFCELNDPKIQRARSQEDCERKKLNGKNAIQLDEEFFQALESGMPPASGIALGLERLFMALMEIRDIAEVRVFPI